MVISFEFCMGQYWDDDHREDAPQFMIIDILEHIEDDLVYIETRLVNKQIESDDETGSSSDEDSDYFDFEDGLIAKIEDVERHNDDEVFLISYGTTRTLNLYLRTLKLLKMTVMMAVMVISTTIMMLFTTIMIHV